MSLREIRHIFNYLYTFCIVIIFIILGFQSNAQSIKYFTDSDGLPSGNIKMLQEIDGVLWYFVEEINQVFEKNESFNYYVGFYDGYSFYNYTLAPLQNTVECKFVAFDFLNEDKLILAFNNPLLIYEFNIHNKTVTNREFKNRDHQFFVQNQGKNYIINNQDETFELYKLNHSKEVVFSAEKNHLNFDFFFEKDSSYIFSSSELSDCGIDEYTKDGRYLDSYSSDLLVPAIDSSCIYLSDVKNYEGHEYYYFNGKNSFIYYQDELSGKYVRKDKPFEEIKYFFDSKGNTLKQIYNQEENKLICKNEKGNEWEIQLNYNLDFNISVLASSDFSDHLWFVTGNKLTIVNFETAKNIKKLDNVSIRGIRAFSEDSLIIGASRFHYYFLNRNTKEITRSSYPTYGTLDFDILSDKSYYTTSNSNLFKFDKNHQINKKIDVGFQIGASAISFTKDKYYLSDTSGIVIYNKTTEEIIEFQVPGYKDMYFMQYFMPYLYLAHNSGLTITDSIGDHPNRLIKNKAIVSIHRFEEYVYVGADDGYIYTIDSDLRLIDSIQLPNIIFNISHDNKGRLWAGTANGTYYQDHKNSDEWHLFPTSLMSHHEANRYAMFYDSIHNEMYVGTVDGLNIINLDNLEQSDQFSIFPSSVSYYQNDTLSTFIEHDKMLNKIKIPVSKRYLLIQFHTDINSNQNHISYEYKINNDDWQDVLNLNRLNFTNIESGHYKIQVRAKNDQGIYSQNILNYNVLVEDYFYNKSWFQIIITSLILLAIIYWIKQIQTKNKRLEQLVDLRTQELNKDKQIIEKQASELNELNQAKNRFFSNISHELRTPLSLIKSPTEQLQKLNYLKEEDKYFVDLIKTNSDLLEDRVTELLELSRMESGKAILSNDQVVLHDIIQQASSIFEEHARTLLIDFQIKNNTSNQSILIDQRRLTKIIQNLIGNAFKFTPANGEITFTCSEENGNLQIEVSDTGIGIEPEHAKHIFDRFYQVPSRMKVANPGTGIGLTMVADYVKLMNGSIHLESEIDNGSRFYVSIPLVYLQEEIADSTQHLRAKSFENLNEKIQAKVSLETIIADGLSVIKPKLLIVEDNPQLRMYLSTLLSNEYDITQASNGKEALKYLEDSRPIDIILSDVMMPEIDGQELLRRVRQDDRFKKLPFVFLSAKTNEDFTLEMFRIGVDDYIHKPFAEDALRIRLATVYSNYKIRLTAAQEEPQYEPDEPIFDNTFAKDLEQLVRKEIRNPQFGVEYIANHFDMSSRHLLRLVKREIGMTPLHYIREVQLHMARQLFEKNKKLKFQDVATELAYSNVSYFKKIYTERFGEPNISN